MRASRAAGTVAGVLTLGLLGAGPSAQNAPGAQDVGLADDEGIVSGRVVDSRTGAPIAGAGITLILNDRIEVPPLAPPPGPVRAEVREGTTGDDGRFELAGVWPPARYSVQASAPGYVPMRFGGPDGGPMGALVEVTGGRRVSDVDFELVPAGALSGRVFGERGSGLSGVELQLMRREFRPGGVRPVAMAWAQSVEGGAFRFPDVPPGEYVVRAAAPEGLAPESPSDAYMPTFFGDVIESDFALRVQVGPGQEAFGIDLSLSVVETFDLDGQLIDPAGQSLAGIRISVNELTTALAPGDNLVLVDEEGAFTIADLRPGEYVLLIQDPSEAVAGRSWPQATRVLDADVEALTIVAELPGRVAGRFMLPDRRPLPFDPSGLSVTLRPADVDFWFGGGAEVDADGTFETGVDAGRMIVRVTNLPSGWIVEGVNADGVPLRDEILQLFPGGRADLEIAVTNQVSAVAGTVTDEDGNTVPRAAVVLFPAERDRWGAARLIRTEFSQPDGSYRLDGVLPGAYALVALPSLPQGAAEDPQVLEVLFPRASAIRLAADDLHIDSIELVPLPAIFDAR